VKLLGQDEKGRVRLSRKAAMEEREKAASGDAPAASESANGGSSADAQE
jgi:predicted RNA-binding protein with RPS1 domain